MFALHPIRLIVILLSAAFTGLFGGDSLLAQDGKDPQLNETVTKIIGAFRDKNFGQLASFMAKSPPESVVKQVQPGTPPYEQFFGEQSPIYKAANSWNGDFDKISIEEQALVVIAERASAFGGNSPNVLDCVRLKKEAGQWRYEKLHIAQKADVNGPTFSELKKGSKQYAELNQHAHEILGAFQRQDLKAIVDRSVEEGPWSLRGDSSKPEKERIFTQSQLDTVAQWQGGSGKVYVKREARVPLATIGKSVFYLQLALVDGTWKLSDIKQGQK
ncbi:hypothetical protein [Stieleria varia]|uniref:Uncharacterized protein n=1 Tax=Stieleria varia TaxID=2528005 RepID=A0A5C5ZWH1_9BACT|nr:hypothetical protein [Stieleria varia]TWT91962.1 hypothetical protein Pla52n_64350 [Stieleria varia]